MLLAVTYVLVAACARRRRGRALRPLRRRRRHPLRPDPHLARPHAAPRRGDVAARDHPDGVRRRLAPAAVRQRPLAAAAVIGVASIGAAVGGAQVAESAAGGHAAQAVRRVLIIDSAAQIAWRAGKQAAIIRAWPTSTTSGSRSSTSRSARSSSRSSARTRRSRRSIESPHRILAFRTFAYIRCGLLLGQLLFDNDVPAYDGSESWIEALLRDPAHHDALTREVRAVAEEIAADPKYADEGPLGPGRRRARALSARSRASIWAPRTEWLDRQRCGASGPRSRRASCLVLATRRPAQRHRSNHYPVARKTISHVAPTPATVRPMRFHEGCACASGSRSVEPIARKKPA